MPSAVLLFVAARAAARLHGIVADAVFHGLKLVAVAVVAQAVWSLGRRLWTDRFTVGIGILAVGVALFWTAPNATLGALGAAALLGAILRRAGGASAALPHSAVGRRTAWAAAATFIVLLVGLPALAFRTPHGAIALAESFYRAGALVFGGGHVVLPLLRGALVPSGWLSENSFLAGYGLAQAVPGPLFTVAAYLGAANAYVGPPLWAAAIAVVSIFLPGMLLALAAAALWQQFAAHAGVRGALVGVNAAVVGILAAALYRPVLITSVHSIADGLIAAVGLFLLVRWKLPPLLVLLFCLAGSATEAWLN
jgi:chromate transporter